MLYDVRTYECRPGTIKMHLDLYEKHGKAPQSRALGNPLAYLVGETGNPNRYIHIWVYENADDHRHFHKPICECNGLDSRFHRRGRQVDFLMLWIVGLSRVFHKGRDAS